MAAGHRSAVAGALECPYQRHREAGVPELFGHLLPDLETGGADGRADGGSQVLRGGPEPFSHQVDRALRHLQDRPFPAGMDGRNDLIPRVVEENGDAVGRPDADGDPGEIRDEGVISLQLLAGHPRTVDDGDLGTVDLMALDDRIG